jgi:uncharacterized membrane protein
MERPPIGRVLISYFLRGLLVLVPITVVLWALWRSLTFLDSIIPMDIPGVGLAVLLTVITVAGWLASTLLFRPFAELGELMLERVPFLKTLYGAVKDLMEALVGNKKKFDQPVLVRLGPGMDAQRIGFMTQTDLSHLGIGTDRVAVYLPHAFAWSGNLVIVPVSNVTPLDARAPDVMKFVVSGGVSQMDDEA